MYICQFTIVANAVLLSANLQTDVSEGNHEGYWNVQQQGGSQEHLGAEARVQALSADRGGRGDPDHLVPRGSSDARWSRDNVEIKSCTQLEELGFLPASLFCFFSTSAKSLSPFLVLPTLFFARVARLA